MINKEFILGALDASNTPYTAEGNTLGVAHNVRKKSSGAVESVCKPNVQYKFSIKNNFKIVFCHYVLERGEFIATRENKIYRVAISGNEIIERERIYSIEKDLQDCEVNFFANGLLLFVEFRRNKRIVCEKIFRWFDSNYVLSNIDNINPPTARISYSYMNSNDEGKLPSKIVSAKINKESGTSNGKFLVEEYSYPYKEEIDRFKSANYIYGGVFFVFAYKMIDGSIIKHSPIYLSDAQRMGDNANYQLYFGMKDNVMNFHQRLFAIQPTINFDVPQEILDNKLIESIVVYSTRNNYMYLFDDIYNNLDFQDKQHTLEIIGGVDYTNISARSIVDTNSIEAAHQNFYKVVELDFRKEKSITLKYREHYDNIEQNEVFVANMSNHNLIGNVKYEYNGRLHLMGVDVIYAKSHIPAAKDSNVHIKGIQYINSNYSNGKMVMITTINVDGEIRSVESEADVSTYYKSTDSGTKYLLLPNMITYPDANAFRMSVFFRNNNGELFFVKSFYLEKSLENACAYFQIRNTDKPMSYIAYAIDKETCIMPKAKGNRIYYPNKIAVSALDNSFLYDYKNILTLSQSDTEIFGTECTANQFQDPAYGFYPLYVFTSKGIYVLQSGKNNIVYKSIMKVNNQIMLEGNPSIAVGSSVYFVDSRGLFALNGSISQYLSSSIEDYKFRDTDFTKYIQNAKLFYSQRYNEICIYNNYYNYCYVYNIDFKCFTTRDFDFEPISKTQMIGDKEISNISFSEHKIEPLFSEIETLATCFGSDKRKRINNFDVVGMFKSDVRVNIFASLNAKDWSQIKSSGLNNIKTCRMQSSWKYYKIHIKSKYLLIDKLMISMQEREL